MKIVNVCRTWLALILLLVSGCDRLPSSEQSLVLEGKTMGTQWRVSLAGVNPARAEVLRQQIQQQLDKQDQTLSTWKPESMVSRFNQSRSIGRYPVTADVADIVTLALRIGYRSVGAMDITIGPLVNLWGFGPDGEPMHTPDDAQIAAAVAKTGLQHLSVINRSDGQWLQKNIPELQIDLSTVGEGYATDRLAQLMMQQGITRYLVSVGGAVVSRGLNSQGSPWRVAIQKPTDSENAVQALVNIDGYGISTSGSYRNYYELDGQRVSHIIDPRSGRPISHNLVSVTVIAETALEADGWDTGLMVLGPQKAREVALRERLAVYLIARKGDRLTTWMSPQFRSFLVNSSFLTGER